MLSLEPAILTFLSSNQAYHTHHPHFLLQFQAHNHPTIIRTMITITHMLDDDQYEPFSRLLGLRWARDAMVGALGYGVAVMAAGLVQGMRLQGVGDGGQGVFLGLAGEEEWLRVMGVSYWTMGVEMVGHLGRLWTGNPYATGKFAIASPFAQEYQALQASGVALPATPTYYKQHHMQKILKTYNASLSDPAKLTAQICSFYSCLLSPLSDPQTLPTLAPTLTQLLRSGDQYCADHIIAYLSQHLQQRTLSIAHIVDILHVVMLSGDIEVAVKAEAGLLVGLHARRGEMGEAEIGKMGGIGGMAGVLRGKGSAMGRLFGGGGNEEQLRAYKKMLDRMAHNNTVKEPIVEKEVKFPEELRALLERLDRIDMESKTLEIKLPEVFEEVDIKSSTPIVHKRPISVTKLSSRVNSQSDVPSRQDRYFFGSSKQQPSHASGMTRQPLMLGGSRRNSRKHSFNKHGASVRESRVQIRVTEQVTRRSIKNQYWSTPDLEQELIKAKEQQSILEKRLKEKEDVIRILSTPKLTLKKFQFSSPYQEFSQVSSSKPGTIVSSANKKIQIKNYKSIKQILKKKVLLTRTSSLQIGLITKVQRDNRLECLLFCTPFEQITQFSASIQVPSWAKVSGKPQQAIDRIKVGSQDIVRFQLGLCVSQANKSQCSARPELSFSYIGEKGAQKVRAVVELPVLPIKFLEHVPRPKSSPSENQQMKGCQIRLNKIVRCFEDLRKYFPEAIISDKNNQVFTVYFEGFNVTYSLQMVMTKPSSAIVKLGKTKSNENMNQILPQVFLDNFSYIFGA